jgi:hypothetical protein
MNLGEIAELLQTKGIEVDPNGPRDAIQIGEELGHIGLLHCGNEPTGSFDSADIAAMRRVGLVVKTIGFGQAVYEAVPISELEV